MHNIDWQLVVEKVEGRLEGWQTKVMSRGGGKWVFGAGTVCLFSNTYVLLLCIQGASRSGEAPGRLDDTILMEKGTRSKQSRCLAMVSWDIVCQPIKRGGLGILHVQIMNTALLMKWVTKTMGPQEDPATLILKDNYGRGLDWVSRSLEAHPHFGKA